MNSKILVAVTRIIAGCAILVTSMVTGENGVFQMISLLLMGVPVEALQGSEPNE